MNDSIGKTAVRVSIAKFVGLAAAFVSSLLVAREFGSNADTDAFFIGWTIPNTLFVILAGALPAVFIPIYSDLRIKQGESEAARFGLSTTLVSMALIFCLVILGTFLSRPLIGLIGRGFDHAQIDRASDYQRILFFIAVFGSLAALMRALLNTVRIFVVPALESLANNICIIGCVLIWGKELGVMALVWGVLAGSLARIVLQMPFVFFLPQARVPSRAGVHPATRDFLRLIVPLLGFHLLVACYMMIGRGFASHEEGAVSYLGYSEKLIGMPVEIVISAFAVALLPSLAQFVSSNRREEFSVHTLNVLRIAMFLMLPITVFAMILRVPVVEIVFERGRFTHEDTLSCARVMLYYAPNILACLGMILTQAFFAMRSTMVLFVLGGVGAVINVVLCPVFIRMLHAAGPGVAMSISVANISFTVLLFIVFARKIGNMAWREHLLGFLKLLMITAAAGGVLYGSDVTLLRALNSYWRLGFGVMIGGSCTLALAFLLRSRELGILISRFRGWYADRRT